MRVLWTARRSNQSILREISPECSLEVPMLKLKPILWPPDAKNSLEKIWEKSWERLKARGEGYVKLEAKPRVLRSKRA